MTKRLLHVDCQKRCPMYITNSMYQVAKFGRDSAVHENLEQLPVDWERMIIIHCKLIPQHEILQKHSYNSFLSCNSSICEVSSCIVECLFSQFMYGEFVNSHFLSSLQFFHFMDNSDASISKCFFSLRQVFVQSHLLSSRFFIPTMYAIQFQTMRTSLSLKFTNASVKSINFTILASRFQISLLRVDDLFVLQELSSQLLPNHRT